MQAHDSAQRRGLTSAEFLQQELDKRMLKAEWGVLRPVHQSAFLNGAAPPGIRFINHDENGAPFADADCRIKWDVTHSNCPKDKDGKLKRYANPPGAGNYSAYAPLPQSWQRFREPTVKHLAEGEFKTIALVGLGYAALGFGGIRLWQKDGQILPELARGIRRGDIVYLWVDGDWQTNLAVRDGAAELMQAIRALGAVPKLVTLPTVGGDGKKVGIDDQIVAWREQEKDPLIETQRLMEAAISEIEMPSLREVERERSQRIGAGEPDPQPTVQPVLALEEMLDRYVYLSDTNEVCEVANPRVAMNPSMFHTRMEASRERINDRWKPTSKLWIGSPKRRDIPTRTWRPGDGPYTRNPDGIPAINLWSPRQLAPPPEGWRELATPFVEHVAFLVPNADERERFLDSLAHIQQQPGAQVHSHYLMIAPNVQGIGRNWLACLLARVWSGEVALNVNLQRILSGSFNAELSRKLLIVVDELHEGAAGSQWDKAEAMKTEFTLTHRKIKPKYGKEHIEWNCARWLMFSNHRDALPINDSDRRIWVIENPSTPRDEAYYSRLYALLDDGSFVRSVQQFLIERDIRAFEPGARPTMNEAKRQMLVSTASDEETALRRLVNEWEADCIANDTLQRELWGDSAEFGSTEANRRRGQLKRMLAVVGAESYGRPVSINSRKIRVTILRGVARWRDETPASVSEEVLRGDKDLGRY